jgi:hypothetical protein
MTTSINSELFKIAKIQYLESMNASELAYWIIHSFSPTRYHDKNDIMEYACMLLYQRSNSPLLIAQFFDKLWAMHGLEPEYAPNIFMNNVVSFRKVNKNG